MASKTVARFLREVFAVIPWRFDDNLENVDSYQDSIVELESKANEKRS